MIMETNSRGKYSEGYSGEEKGSTTRAESHELARKSYLDEQLALQETALARLERLVVSLEDRLRVILIPKPDTLSDAEIYGGSEATELVRTLATFNNQIEAIAHRVDGLLDRVDL